MKKCYTLFLFLLLNVAATAQRDIDLEVTVTDPACGAVITSGDPFPLQFDWINNGPDTILAGDTMRLKFFIDAVQVDSGFFIQTAPLLPGYGMSIPIQYVINVPDSLTGVRSFCVYSFIQGAASTVADADLANNTACNDSITFLNANGVGVAAFIKDRDKVAVYPVPATDMLTLGYDDPGNGEVLITLFDINGRKVKEVKDRGGPGYKEWQMDVSGLSNGNYSYSLIVGDKISRGKFCISK